MYPTLTTSAPVASETGAEYRVYYPSLGPVVAQPPATHIATPRLPGSSDPRTWPPGPRMGMSASSDAQLGGGSNPEMPPPGRARVYAAPPMFYPGSGPPAATPPHPKPAPFPSPFPSAAGGRPPVPAPKPHPAPVHIAATPLTTSPPPAAAYIYASPHPGTPIVTYSPAASPAGSPSHSPSPSPSSSPSPSPSPLYPPIKAVTPSYAQTAATPPPPTTTPPPPPPNPKTRSVSPGSRGRQAAARAAPISPNVLHNAVRNNAYEDAKTLLEVGVSPNTPDEFGEYPLHIACHSTAADPLPMLALLLTHRADPNARDTWQFTPLLAAATQGHVAICEYLLSLPNVEADAKGCEGVTPLMALCKGARAIPPSERPRLMRVIETLLQRGASVNQKNEHFETPLLVAALSGSNDVAEFLLSKGAVPDCRSRTCDTPLHYAVRTNNAKLVDVLLEYKARTDLHSTTTRKFAFQEAQDLGLEEIAQKILAHYSPGPPTSCWQPPVKPTPKPPALLVRTAVPSSSPSSSSSSSSSPSPSSSSSSSSSPSTPSSSTSSSRSSSPLPSPSSSRSSSPAPMSTSLSTSPTAQSPGLSDSTSPALVSSAVHQVQGSDLSGRRSPLRRSQQQYNLLEKPLHKDPRDLSPVRTRPRGSSESEAGKTDSEPFSNSTAAAAGPPRFLPGIKITETTTDTRGSDATVAFGQFEEAGGALLTDSPPSGFVSEGSRGDFQDHFILGKHLGQGAFATVYECKEKETGHMYAVKVVSNSMLSDENMVAMERELEILKRVRHPNIISLKDIYRSELDIYIVTDLVSGGELFDRIKLLARYTEDDARKLLRNICSAIAYLHSNGIVHRDLKPENLLLENSSDHTAVKLADFGLARFFDEGAAMRTTCGTPAYISPEMLEGTSYGPSVDMWAIGVIGYILLTGNPPFAMTPIARLMFQILHADIPFPEERWAGISDHAKSFISGLLDKDPKTRMTAAQALAHPWLNSQQQLPTELRLSSQLSRFQFARHSFFNTSALKLQPVQRQ